MVRLAFMEPSCSMVTCSAQQRTHLLAELYRTSKHTLPARIFTAQAQAHASLPSLHKHMHVYLHHTSKHTFRISPLRVQGRVAKCFNARS
eukprot:scaffold54743_cov19-Tisochrysis_lutea.AAC.1